MASHHYHFITHWRVEAMPEEVYRIIEDTAGFVRWWPAVWLRVDVLEPGDASGVGAVVRLTSKGWLPYVLVWQSTTLEKTFPQRIVIEASGDFEGRGEWTFRPDGSFVEVEYRWDVAADKPLLRYLSFLMRPIFAANHNWAMRKGEESLRLELARRRARTDEERARIPPPPPPVLLGARQRRRLGLP